MAKKPAAKETKVEEVPVFDLDNNLAQLSGKPLVAKKDFTISHNHYHRKIKVGDDLSDVPALYHENLKTEGVL